MEVARVQQPNDHLRRAISDERIEGYRCSPEETDVDLFARYFWNIALSQALYPQLQTFEVALRNSISLALSQTITTDWLVSPSYLRPTERLQVPTAIERIARQGHPVTSGRIIAALSFGFWTSLLDSRYEQLFWPRSLQAAFPHMPRRLRTRRFILHRVDSIRTLRNRVFHYEPIWRFPDLEQRHMDLLAALNWVAPSVCAVMTSADRFSEIQANGPSMYRPMVESALRTG
jgi:hypothetical protein